MNMKRAIFLTIAFLLCCGMAFAQTETKDGFVPGDEVIFNDQVTGEKVGSAPSRWDFYFGDHCVVTTLNDSLVIKISEWYTRIIPKMKLENYLPDKFTVEFEVWSPGFLGESMNDHINLLLYSEYREDLVEVELNPAVCPDPREHAPISYHYYNPSDEYSDSILTDPITVAKALKQDTWAKVQASFDKGSFKYYLNGELMVSLSNVARPTRMALESVSNCDEQDRFYVRNIRIAKFSDK